MTSIVILSVGLVTLSATAARIQGMRLGGSSAAPRSAGAVAAESVPAPGPDIGQRPSVAMPPESDPSATSGSTWGKPKALTVGLVATGAACTISATYVFESAVLGAGVAGGAAG